MKTVFAVLKILYQMLSSSPLNEAITGEVYKLQRPAGSALEDVVINTLPLSGDQIQRGTANVNVYVPDLKTMVASKPLSMPDTARLDLLTELAITMLEQRYAEGYSFWTTGTNVIAEPESGQHYVNIRIEFQFFPST